MYLKTVVCYYLKKNFKRITEIRKKKKKDGKVYQTFLIHTAPNGVFFIEISTMLTDRSTQYFDVMLKYFQQF